MRLDDMQLEEEDTSTERFEALSSVKEELTTAKDIMECRLDLIEKVDGSSVGWVAASFYEKSNGLVLKSDSAKNWTEAEKSAREIKRKAEDKRPFRPGPGQPGKVYQPPFQRTDRGSFSVFSSLLFCFFFVLFMLRFDCYIFEVIYLSEKEFRFSDGNNEIP